MVEERRLVAAVMPARIVGGLHLRGQMAIAMMTVVQPLVPSRGAMTMDHAGADRRFLALEDLDATDQREARDFAAPAIVDLVVARRMIAAEVVPAMADHRGPAWIVIAMAVRIATRRSNAN